MRAAVSEPRPDLLLEACTACGRCRGECALLRARGTPRAVALAAGRDPDRAFAWVFECSLCGLCEAVCPREVPVVQAFRELRRRAVREGRAPLRALRGLLRYEALGSSLPLRLHRIPRGCRSVLFPGCALPGNLPGHTLRLYRLLRQGEPGLGLVLDCCFKPSLDLGLEERFRQRFGRLAQTLRERGVEEVIAACPSCLAVWREHAPGIRAVSAYERLAGLPLVPAEGLPGRAAVHDPCTARRNDGLHRAVRRILERLGVGIEEMPHRRATALCCGEGAGARFTAPGFAAVWTGRRLREAAGRPLAVYCAGCAETLGRRARAVHLLEFAFGPGPGRAGTLRRIARRAALRIRCALIR